MDVEITGVDLGGDFLGGLAVNGATEGHTGSEDFLDGALELDGHALGAELLGNVDDVGELEVAVVLHVLLLLSVAGAFLKCLNNEGSGSGHHGDEALSVLDHHFDLDLDSAPVSSGLLDIFTDFLGGHTEGTALGGEGGSTGHFTSDNFEVNYIHTHKTMEHHLPNFFSSALAGAGGIFVSCYLLINTILNFTQYISK